MLRLGLVLLALVVASPAYPLPVGYSFTSQADSGTFSYDAETGLGTLEVRVLGVYPVAVSVPAVITITDGELDSLDIVGPFLQTWPPPDGLAPYYGAQAELHLVGPALFVGGALRSDLVWGVDAFGTISEFIGWVEGGSSECVLSGAPVQDCPFESFTQRSDASPSGHLLSLQALPEPEALGALVAIGTLLAIRRRARTYGQ